MKFLWSLDEGYWAETSAVYTNQQHLRGFYTKENHRGHARFDHKLEVVQLRHK